LSASRGLSDNLPSTRVGHPVIYNRAFFRARGRNCVGLRIDWKSLYTIIKHILATITYVLVNSILNNYSDVSSYNNYTTLVLSFAKTHIGLKELLL